MEGVVVDTCIPSCPYCQHRPPPPAYYFYHTYQYESPVPQSSPTPTPPPPPPTPPPPPQQQQQTFEKTSRPRQVKRIPRRMSRTKSQMDEGFTEKYRKRQAQVKPRLTEVDIPIGDNPNWSDPSLYIMGLMFSIVMVWTAMIIPSTLAAVIGGGNVEKAEAIQSSLFTAAINTLSQILFGSELPVVMQSSQVFINPAISIAISTRNRFSSTLTPPQMFRRSMRRIQGASIIGSFVQIIIGFSGLGEIFASKLSLLSSIPLVTLTGLGLYDLGFPQMAKCIGIGLPAALSMIISTQFLPYIWKSTYATVIRSVMITLSIGTTWTFAEILTAAGAFDNASQQTQSHCRADRSGLISAAPWINLPNPFQWGHPTFEVRDVFLMMVACVVATVETTGTLSSSSRLAGEFRAKPPKLSSSITTKAITKSGSGKRHIRYRSALPISPDLLRYAIGFQGFGTLFDAIFGMGLGSSASVEHSGLLGLTRVGSLRVAFVSAIFLLLFSTLGKVTAILASVPLPILASLHIVFFPYVVSTGLEDLYYCELDKFRSKFIMGISLFMGLSMNKYFSDYDLFSAERLPASRSSWFKDVVQVIFSSAATTATIFAFLLDMVTPRTQRKEPKKEEPKKTDEQKKKEEPKKEEPKKQEEEKKKKKEEPKKEEVVVMVAPEPEPEPLRPLKEDWKTYTKSTRSASSTLGIRRYR